VTGVPVVSVVNVTSAVQFTGSLTESTPEAWTVVSLVYQPFVPGVPAVTARVALGAVLSILITMGAALAAKPAAFVHEPFTVVPGVSAVNN
jgi:hypothetical protein